MPPLLKAEVALFQELGHLIEQEVQSECHHVVCHLPDLKCQLLMLTQRLSEWLSVTLYNSWLMPREKGYVGCFIFYFKTMTSNKQIFLREKNVHYSDQVIMCYHGSLFSLRKITIVFFLSCFLL